MFPPISTPLGVDSGYASMMVGGPAPFVPDPCGLDAVARVVDNGDTLIRVSVPHLIGDDEVVERRFSEVLTDPEEG